MTTEVIDGAAPAQTSETADPAAAQNNAAATPASTDGAEGGEESPAQEKTFTQKELDDILQKRIAKAEARAERRVLRTLERVLPQQQPTQAKPQQADERPQRQNGEADDAYLERLTDWKLEQRDKAHASERQSQQAQTFTQKTEKLYADAAKVPGFDREAFDALADEGHLTRPMVEALIDSDQAPKLMHHLAANPEEAERIARMSPARQAAELGKLEAKLATAPTPKPSKTPTPHTPVGAAGNTAGLVDLSKASMDEYIKRRTEQGAIWAR